MNSNKIKLKESIIKSNLKFLEKKGIVLTNPELLFEEEIFKRFCTTENFTTDAEYQENLNKKVAKLNEYLNFLGKEKLAFLSVDFENMPSKVTVEEFLKINNLRKEKYRDVFKDLYEKESILQKEYVSGFFDMVTKEALSKNAKAIIFKRNGFEFYYEENKNMFSKIVQSIKKNEYAGSHYVCYECGFATLVLMLLNRDVKALKERFMNPCIGFGILSDRGIPSYELIL